VGPYVFAFSGVIEANNIYLCTDLPSSPTTFNAPSLQEIYENKSGSFCPAKNGNVNAWTVENWWTNPDAGFPTTCGYNVALLPNGQVTLSP
jgi:hypothetical protein